MELDKSEKDLIAGILKEHLKLVKNEERVPNQQIVELSGELNYEEFVEKVIKKLE